MTSIFPVFFIATAVLSAATIANARAVYACKSNTSDFEPIMSLLVVSATSKASCPEQYQQIDQDLNQGAGGKYIYACIVRGDANTRYGVPLTSLKATSGSNSKNQCASGSVRISQDINAGAGGDYVYFCTSRFGDRAITDIAFVTNSQTCPNGYERDEVDLNSGTGPNTSIFACVQYGCEAKVEVPTRLNFKNDGTFKIAQFTDAHYGESYDKDILSAASIYRTVLEIEEPDLVALTGDQVSGYAWDGTAGWFKEIYPRVTDTLLSMGIPYFFLNGNHDPQADLSQREIVEFDISHAGALSLTQLGPENITGASNYVLSVYSSSDEKKVGYNFWVLDSNGENCENVDGWGCVAEDQVDWYRSKAAELGSAAGGALPPALAYFHIPIDEYLMVNAVANTDSSACSGRKSEDICCSSVNTGVFKAFKDVGDVSATFVGHDHDNDFGFKYDDIEMYYGRKSGYGGYGPPVGWKRGARVVTIREGVRGVAETWVRQEDGSRMDLTQCARLSSQGRCCGTADAVADSAANSTASGPLVGLSKLGLVDFQNGFNAAFAQTPNKCELYESTFRQGLRADAAAVEHAKIDTIKV